MRSVMPCFLKKFVGLAMVVPLEKIIKELYQTFLGGTVPTSFQAEVSQLWKVYWDSQSKIISHQLGKTGQWIKSRWYSEIVVWDSEKDAETNIDTMKRKIHPGSMAWRGEYKSLFSTIRLKMDAEMGLTSNSLVAIGNFRNYPTYYQTAGHFYGHVSTFKENIFEAFVVPNMCKLHNSIVTDQKLVLVERWVPGAPSGWRTTA